MKIFSITLFISLLNLTLATPISKLDTNLDPLNELNIKSLSINKSQANEDNKVTDENVDPNSKIPNIVGMTLIRKEKEAGNTVTTNSYLESNLPKPYRIIPPRTGYTREIRPDRFNVFIDENNKITKTDMF